MIETREATTRTRLCDAPVGGDVDVTRAIEYKDDERNVLNESHV